MLLARRLAFVLPLLTLTACVAPGVDERTAEERDPIIGGVPDTFRSYVVGVGAPYNPANPNDPNAGPFCSGTLISRRTVLTAGHCYTPGMGAQGGITAIFFGPDISPTAQVTPVKTVQAVRHPGFSDTTLTNDLTLVELAADAPSQAAPLLRETMTNGPAFVGPDFTFVGYGNDGASNYNTRLVAVFPIDAVGPDATVGLDTGSGPIDGTEFYYRVANKNTCDGDSGGPAFVVRGHVERLAGSTSSGDFACQIDGTDARTDAPAIAAFIQPTIDLFEGKDPCRADGVCDESCNVNHTLVDPDCAPDHCGMDGMCVLSCVDPPDPDCAAVSHCDSDGVCDPTCPSDPDCLDGGAGAGGGGGSGPASSSSSGGPPADAGAPDGGAGGRTVTPKSGCGCSTPGSVGGGERLAAGLAFVALALARRRRR